MLVRDREPGDEPALRAFLEEHGSLRVTLKPEIPLIGDHGIPIRDEIVLERG